MEVESEGEGKERKKEMEEGIPTASPTPTTTTPTPPPPSPTSDQEDDEHDVGEEGGEVDDFPGRLDALGQARAHDHPRQRQAAHQLPAHVAHVFPSGARHAQHAVPVGQGVEGGL